MRKKKTKKTVHGWHEYAGHKWPIKSITMEKGVIRIVSSGYAVNDVDAGASPTALYGTDGAMVFRTSAAKHNAMESGVHTTNTMDFYMERDFAEIQDSNLGGRDVSVENWFRGAIVDASPSGDPTTRAWYVMWRGLALVLLAGIVSGAIAMSFPALWWGAPIVTVGTLCGVLYAEHVTTSKGKR